MNTAQLIVLWYAGLLIAGLLTVHAQDAGLLYVIAAVTLLAALTIYTLKPHPARKRWVAVGVLLPPILLGVTFWGYLRHTARVTAERQAAEEAERRTARAAEEVQEPAENDYSAEALLAAAEEQKRQEAAAQQRQADEAFLGEIKSGIVRDGRWLPVALDTNHIRYFVDSETLEVVRWQPDPLAGLAGPEAKQSSSSLRLWVRRADAADVPRDVVQLTVACRGHRVVGPHGVVLDWEWWAYKPGTIAEEIVRWVERSKWCEAAVQEDAERAATLHRGLDDMQRLFLRGSPAVNSAPRFNVPPIDPR